MKRFFLVGSPRSGTTLLQSLLGCSPELTTFQESHLYSHALSRRLPVLVPLRSPVALARRFYTENGIDPAALPAFFAPARLSSRAIARYFLEVLDRAASSRGRTAWLEKTPRHLLYTDLIETAAQSVRKPVQFIHLVRDGVGVASSLAKASQSWNRPTDPADALARWQKEVRLTRALMGRANHHLVIYEHLVKTPEAVALSLARKCGFELSEADLLRRTEVLSEIVRADESWKTDTAQHGIGQLDRAATHIGAEQVAQLETTIDRRDYDWLCDHALAARA
ncbi:sulfotransferase family protein [Phaeovulum sp. W22_SRMD_FR3]|uniref:sulfotransferase family protein n=1 Tax=Phaeovulum sp. W22_SRMD_FR3 TaxID=3240274 RepID=UPI003F9AE991